MLHTKSQCHRHSSSGEEFLKFFYHLWAWRQSWSCDHNHLNKLSFLRLKKYPYENLNLIGPVVSEEMFENVDGRMPDDGWTPE